MKKSSYDEMLPLSEHLRSLRKTILICLLVIISGMIICYAFFRKTFMEIALLPIIGKNVSIVYTSVAESFTTEMQVSLIAGIIVTSPIAAFFIWRFAAPAFFDYERKRIVLLFVVSMALFAAGVLFGYFVMLPYIINFLLSASSINSTAMITIGSYVSFVGKMMIPFGVVFETPVIISLMLSKEIVSVEQCAKARKYVFLACFICGAILTPPDIVSQLSVALPMYVMYESGLMVNKIRIKTAKSNEAK